MGEIQAKAAQTSGLMAVFSNFNIRVPQLEARVDRIKAMQLGVEVQDIFDTMQSYVRNGVSACAMTLPAGRTSPLTFRLLNFMACPPLVWVAPG
jgi:multidrug efflux pump subunit AcrB